MVFSSIIFLFLFLPIALSVYYVFFLPVILGRRPRFWRRASNLFLLAASCVFYFWGEQYLLWIVVTSTTIDYVCGLFISGGFRRRQIQSLDPGIPRTRGQKLALVISICSNLAFLAVFKYFNFGVSGYNNLVQSLGLEGSRITGLQEITLPLGISFYTFQSMSYTIDVYRGQVCATRNFIDFACYVTMFPQLVAGPIIRYRDIARQLVGRMISRQRFVYGVSRFVVGLGKKVLIANTVAVAADKVFALPTGQLATSVAWLGVLAYTLQIYFDFSGYSDMAIGLGSMLGFRFKENFNYPYASNSLRDFWRRWHISLATWFRDYLYIPLGGSRCSNARTLLNLVTVFFLCGLWHGAGWTFVIWGLYHGLFLILERVGLQKLLRKSNLLGHVYAILVICCGWVIFRSETFSQALGYLSAMAGFDKATAAAPDASWYLSRELRIAIITGVIFSMPVVPAFNRWRRQLLIPLTGLKKTVMGLSFSAFDMVCLVLVMLISFMSLSAGTHNPFIYFRF